MRLRIVPSPGVISKTRAMRFRAHDSGISDTSPVARSTNTSFIFVVRYCRSSRRWARTARLSDSASWW